MANDETRGQSWEYPETNRPAQPPPEQQQMPPAQSSGQPVRDGIAESAREMVHPATAPATRTRVADDLLLLFGRLAAVVLFMVVMLTAIEAMVHPDKDLSGVYNLINTQLSLIIGAVLGYAAHPSEKDR